LQKPILMGIDKEISSSYFRNEYHKAMVNVVLSSNWILENMKQLIESEDITHQQYNILRILRESKKPLSTLQIREQMIDKMSDTSRIVERLLKKELVHKQTASHDKRLVDITISPKGLEVLGRLDMQNERIDAIAAALSFEEVETLNKLLDKMREKP
jgi:DNA-binding MarR family transcriptional regulator